jgi:AmmeMemoRadiSam system protein B
MMRRPAVAGRFYPAEAETLQRSIELCLGNPQTSQAAPAIGCMVPHAGYPYSGPVAGAVYRRLNPPSRFILIGPRHYPAGQPMAILSQGAWLTPFGPVPVDAALAAELKHSCPLLREDVVAHEREHALEVQLPFLQRISGEFTFVPIALGTTVLAALEELGEAIALVVKAERDSVLIVASSDMNHYESDTLTRAKDERAIERILAMDPHGLFNAVRDHDISMCGFAAAVTMLVAARRLGATAADLVAYATSGDITGDREAVVGYAGVIVR